MKEKKPKSKLKSKVKATPDVGNKDEVKSTKSDLPKSQVKLKKTQKEPQTMEELLESTNYNLTATKKGDTVTGLISRVSRKEITIDIGGKTEGVVIDREMQVYKDTLMNLSLGDEVTAQVIVSENDRGQPVLSLRKSIFEKNWKELIYSQEKKESVSVTIKDQVRGGVLVDCGGLRGYIPQSQLDTSIAKQTDKAINKKISVKVMEVDQNSNRLVLSQRAVVEEENLEKQKALLPMIAKNDTVEALITGVVTFGAFAKFNISKDKKDYKFEGLIHISEIAWEKVEDPNQYIKSGDKIKVKIIGIDKESGKITLSLKQLMPDPWENVLDVFEKDSQVKGKVSRVTPYGVFVSLSPGVEGLIHISKITPGEESKVGDDIECTIEDIAPDKRKISLSPTLKEKPIGYR